MAGLLNPHTEQVVLATLKMWASTPCAPFPCANDVLIYAAEVAGLPTPHVPPHTTVEDMAHLLRARGGLAVYADELLSSIGWSAVAAPSRGDVGIVKVPGMGRTCAICLVGSSDLPPVWAMRGNRTVLSVKIERSRSWRFACLKL